MIKIFLRIFGYRNTQLTMFQAAIAANIKATSNYKTLRGPAGLNFDMGR